MMLLLLLLYGLVCIAVGAIYRDTIRDLYDDARDLFRRIE